MHKNLPPGSQERDGVPVREIIIGMSDRLTVPFALAAGLSGALLSPNVIIIAVTLQVTAGAITMGLGGYFAGKEDPDHNTPQHDEANPLPDQEKIEVKSFFSSLGLSEEVQARAVDEMAKDKKTWFEFVSKFELGLHQPDAKQVRKNAIMIGLSYVVGGIIPLSPYFFAADAFTGLKYSVLITLVCLFIFGYFRSKLSGQNALQGGIRVMLIGAAAAGCAYGIARWIEG